MSADTLTADGAPVTLATPQPSNSSGNTHYSASGFAVPADNPDEIVVISGDQNYTGLVTGYGLDGSVLFSNSVAGPQPSYDYSVDPSISANGGGGVALSWLVIEWDGNADIRGYTYTNVVSDSGQASTPYQTSGTYDAQPTAIFSAPSGYHLEWAQQASNPFDNPYDPYTLQQQDFQTNGQPADDPTGTPGRALIPWTSVSIGANTFTISDNQAQLSGQAAVTVPGEPAHAMTQVVAAALGDGHSAAVAWLDSGTEHLSIYDASDNSFGANLTLDWGGASDTHVAALPDGGVAVSWMNGGTYYGELFDAAGNGGGKISLAGDVAGINSAGKLYTVAPDANGNEVVQTYAIGGSGGSTGGGTTGGGSTGGGTSGGTSGGGADTLTANGGPVDLGSGNVVARGYTTVYGSDEVVVAYAYADRTDVYGYDLSGNQVFALPEFNTGMGSFFQSFSLASAGGAGFIMAFTLESQMNGTTFRSGYQLINAAGQTSAQDALVYGEYGLTAFSAQNGAHLEWNTVGYSPNTPPDPTSYTYTAADVSSSGTLGQARNGGTGPSPVALVPYANTQVGQAGDLVITDNSAQLGSHAAVTLPGEPAHALSDVAAAGLASGTAAAVAWVDSGTEHLSIYDASGNSFGANLTLDWGGASDTHVVALPDGGFVVSWMNGGAYYGEVFDAAGDGGGKISLAGDAAGVDSAGDFYTVGLVSSSNNQHYQLQVYAVNGSGSPQPSTVYTSDPDYTAPAGVSTIYLTGSNQTIHANNGGDTIWSDDTKNVLFGGAGNDTFHIGRAGDIITGGDGADTFAYATVPWGGSTIADFSGNAGDVIDLTGMLADQHYTGSDPFADGYLKYGADSSGNAQIWADYNQANNNTWWLVATLDGVSTSSLHYANGLIT